MKFCEKCGNEIMDEAVICPKCGCAVQKEKPSVPKQTYEQTISSASTCVAIGSVLLVLGILAGLFVSILLGSALCLAAEIVLLIPNTKFQKLFKQNNGHITDKKARKTVEKEIRKELKQKNGAYAFSFVLAVVALIGVIGFAVLI